MTEFARYHPMVNFIYFATVIGLSMFSSNIVFIGLSLLSSGTFMIMLKGKKALLNLVFAFPLFLACVAINTFFNHRGMTILFYLMDNPITLESIMYGVCTGGMLLSVINWFVCYNAIMTSDKTTYLFGRLSPSISLIFTMVLRLVPKYNRQVKAIRNSMKCVGKDVTNGNLLQKTKNGLAIFSGLTTWALENGVDTADSMKARGYGLKGRTSFHNYKMVFRDFLFLGFCVVFIVLVALSIAIGANKTIYFPKIKIAEFSVLNIFGIIAYLFLCFMPIYTEIYERIKWKLLF